VFCPALSQSCTRQLDPLVHAGCLQGRCVPALELGSRDAGSAVIEMDGFYKPQVPVPPASKSFHGCSQCKSTFGRTRRRLEVVKRMLGRSEKKAWFYVSCAETKQILVFELDENARRLSLVEEHSVAGPEGPSLTSMPLAITPDHRFLYAAVRSGSYPASSFAIDPSSGRLSSVGTTNLPYSMAYIGTDRSGRFLFGASYSDAKVSVSAILPEGQLQREPVALLNTPSNPHSVVPDKANQIIYITCLGEDLILQHGFNSVTGHIEANRFAPISTRPGAGPRHQVLHPSGCLLYVLNELDATVASYRISQSQGLTPLQIIGLLPSGTRVRPSAADLHLTPDGGLLYGSDRGSSTLTSFIIDRRSGLLSRTSTISTEISPRGFNIDPSGSFLLAAGQHSDAVSLYAIVPLSGGLERIGRYATRTNPNWIETIGFQRASSGTEARCPPQDASREISSLATGGSSGAKATQLRFARCARADI